MVGKKLLVADDSLTIQKVIRLALSNEGYEIKAVSDGNEAVQEISVFRPNVVLIDVSLPGKTAFEVKKIIHDMHDFEETRFILMSSAFEKVDEAQYQSLEFHGRFTKPFDPAHLRKVLSEVLGQVVAKRMETTELLQKPGPQMTMTPPPPPLDLSDEDLPILPDAPPPPLLKEEDFEPLDLQQWAVDDRKKMKMTPPPSPTFPSPPSTPPEFKILGENDIGSLHPDVPGLEPGKNFADMGGSNFPIDKKNPSASLAIELSDEEDDLPPPVLMDDEEDIEPVFQAPPSLEPKEIIAGKPIQSPMSGGGSNMTSAPDKAWVEQLVRKQVEESLSSLAQRLLPDIAEKVIKAEIHKLLQQTP